MRITARLKEIKKRRALISKQTVVQVTNSVGKGTIVVLTPSFFYFFNPFFVSGHAMETAYTLSLLLDLLIADLKLLRVNYW